MAGARIGLRSAAGAARKCAGRSREPPDARRAAGRRPCRGGSAWRRARRAASGDAQKSICLLLESAARAHDLPIEFFARVIWQESRFRADAIGPVTRSGQARARHRPIHAGNGGRAKSARTRSIRSRRCRNPPSSSTNCAASSATSASPPRPTTPVRGAFASGWPAPARCRRKPGLMCRRSPARSVEQWAKTTVDDGQQQVGRDCGTVDGDAQARAEHVRRSVGAARHRRHAASRGA